MAQRIPPSAQIKQEISALLNGSYLPEHPLDAFLRLGAQYLLQVAVEQEVTEFLGRAPYQRKKRSRRGWRNGYEPKTLKSSEGKLLLSLPQVRNAEEPFRSQWAQTLGSRTQALEQLVTRMYVRGLSTRDIQGLFRETVGPLLSKSGVSQVAQELTREWEFWRRRDLSGLAILYLFLDAIYLPVRQGVKEREGVLCAYGITEGGEKVLLHLALGSRESYDAWLSFLHDLTSRGLQEPLLIISDKNPGLKKALREVFPQALRQRCQVHKMRNLLAKLPKAAIASLKPLIQRVFLAKSYDQGIQSGKALIARFRERFPSAMECLAEDLEECLTYLKFPPAHRRLLRTTNLLERTFEEGRRRTKVIPRFPSETACLKLVYATLITASQGWRGAQMSPQIRRELEGIRRQIFPPLSAVA